MMTGASSRKLEEGFQTTQIPKYVQEMVAATNGRMYVSLLGKLSSYPIPKLPFSEQGGGRRFLDVGCGWGRWLVSAARQGYVPVGMDLKWEAARATQKVLKDHGVKGFVVVADLRHFPFKEATMEVVWSYSVIQHVHRSWGDACFQEIHRVLTQGGCGFLEFPMKSGLWNRVVQQRRREDETDIQSWCVRYHTREELNTRLGRWFPSIESRVHCFFGIGIQPEDLKYVPFKFRPQIYASLILTAMSRFLPLLRRLADSLYFKVRKEASKS